MADTPAVKDQQTTEQLQAQIRRLEQDRQRAQEGQQQAEILLEQKMREVRLANQELEQQNKELQQRAAEIELLHTIALALRDKTGLRPIMQEYLNAVCKMCNWPVGHVYIANKKHQLLVSLEIWHLPEKEAATVFKSPLLKPSSK
jgi:DNA repair exonuclease SbcCD ATPase subunit